MPALILPASEDVMFIFLKNYKCSAKTAMQICGYIYRPPDMDWIRPEAGGRWHAKLKRPKVLDIHYDVFIDKKHVVFDMPLAANAERKRMLFQLSVVKMRDMPPEELTKLMKLNRS